MNNYEYIVASLPQITAGWKPGDTSPEDIIDEIIGLCSEKDRTIIGFLLKGYDQEGLDADFYELALSHKDPFIREYFRFDLNVRNAKVRYLNKALSRDSEKDIVTVSCDGEEFEEAPLMEAILNQTDILERERGIDDLMWNKIDSLTTFNYFDLDAILGFIAKLNIVSRWYRLDDNTGREMFKRLVDEVRGTFKGVEYKG